MRGFSKAVIAGNITRDPELATTPSGMQNCRFSVAVNRKYKETESVSYIDCIVWGAMAETLCKYTRKGSPILVSGRLEQSSWDDKTTGQKRSRTEIVVEDFNFINDGGAGAGSSTSSRAAKPAASSEAEFVPDDIPGDEINMDDIPF